MKINKYGILFGVGVTFIALLVISANISDIRPKKETMTFKPIHIIVLGEGSSLSAGQSGFLEFFLINLSSADSTGYGRNSSSDFETWASANMVGKTPYADLDNFNIEFQSEKTFAILIRVRYNKTHAWDTNKFIGSDTDCQLTFTAPSWTVGSNINNVSGTRYESRNDTSELYIWENFVWDNSGTGYQLPDDGSFNCEEIYIEAKF